ncbi:DNA-3-methyladenine glycosylase 2 family protein [Gordonia desulfuricans]|uniref:DNA-3-methyladenine glycosylase II n=1 Tax=Gordonia desulfuricans TaxID=89051 RepID=A0A7K3LI79_9ACTN|nr:Ada metal-binding domain-containing protein [Gordonia desulfuricans]NDK87978.1 DNA-3-methyladenine glycosylase 2 family protein [Gordonia desulfuricans]
MTTTVDLDFDRCYRALQARDTRFDGQFFVAVRTTGIYCRPSCPSRTPLPRNVDFVVTAATAQARGFRACLRCLPDAVPGSPRWNLGADLSARAMRLISDGTVERDGVGGLARRLGYSQRHLTRVLTAELGAGPLALARAHRATNARILTQCTELPMGEVAFAAGFASIRQFNDTIREVFGVTPTQLRARRRAPTPAVGADASSDDSPVIVLRLAHRRPFDAAWLGHRLAAHAVAGVEELVPDPEGGWSYRRVLDLAHGPALAVISPADGYLLTRLEHLDLRDLGAAVNRLRRLFDLDADTAAVGEALSADAVLAPVVAAAPGVRLPGSVDGAETVIRTMIGQQISVAAARTHIAALVARLGEPTGWPGGWRRFPTAATIAASGAAVLTGPQRRIRAIVETASAIAGDSVELHAGVAASDLHAQLLALPGIGPWTADQVALQITGDPDILLHHDLVVRHAAADLGLNLADTAHWSPWRSYASMHLWRHRLFTPTLATPSPEEHP